jgi:hypothetical protein
MANAFARSASSKVVEMIASVAGIISEAPTPSMTASPRISALTDQEATASSDPTLNSAAPITKIRQCPCMSPSRPPITSKAAKVNA